MSTAADERADLVCEEAMQLIEQGKLVQPRRLLEASLRTHPLHLPSRIAIVEISIREGNPSRATREAHVATSLALAQCREAGVSEDEYPDHPAGRLLLRALRAAARAHRAAGESNDAINAYAAALQKDPADRLDVCKELIEIFLDQSRPQGVVGLYRLGFTHGQNLIDVVLAAIWLGDLQTAYGAMIDGIESVPESATVFANLFPRDDVDDPFAISYLLRMRPYWSAVPHAREIVRRILSNPIVSRTLELLEELDEAQHGHPAAKLDEGRAAMFANLRSKEVVESVVRSLKG